MSDNPKKQNLRVTVKQDDNDNESGLNRLGEGFKQQQREPEGDETCFLFNLTKNLRFNAQPSRSFYTRADSEKIQFGNNDLVITEDFYRVTSNIKPPQLKMSKKKKPLEQPQRKGKNSIQAMAGNDVESHFCFGNSLIP